VAAVIMNLPSLDKYESQIAKGGTLIVNASLVNREVQRTDLDVVMIPAQEIAESIGNRRLMNIVMLGALLQRKAIMPLEDIEQALNNHLPERHRRMLPANIQALRAGAAFARGEQVI
jgi:2-oxoglutarate ferredoxin oxidoreductase subunit gamma